MRSSLPYLLILCVLSLLTATCGTLEVDVERTTPLGGTPTSISTSIPTRTPVATDVVPTVAPERVGYPPDTRTGVHIVDAIIEAVLADDLEAERALVHYTTTACTTVSGLGGPPKCRADETEGTLVEAFPVLGVEGMHVRREEIDGVFLSGRKALYAVYRVPAEAFEADYWPAGEYGVVFVHDDPQRPYPAATMFLADAGGIVRVVYSQSLTSSLRMDFGLEVEEFILPPFDNGRSFDLGTPPVTPSAEGYPPAEERRIGAYVVRIWRPVTNVPPRLRNDLCGTATISDEQKESEAP